MSETQVAKVRSVHGEWWVAEAPSTKVVGTLTYGSDAGIRLRLSADPSPGGGNDFVSQLQRWRGQATVILGQSDEDELFTVVDAVAYSFGNRMEFFANRLLRGQHLTDAQTATFSHMVFEVDHLEGWAGGPLLADAVAQDQTGLHAVTLFLFETDTARYKLEAHASPFFRERESGERYTCTVVVTMLAPTVLKNVVDEIEKFLSMMTIFVGTPVRPRMLRVSQTTDLPLVDLIIPWGRASAAGLSHHDMLVPYQGVREKASLIFADSEGWRSAFQTDVDHDSEVMPISVPN
jgi:hypothetical protein